MLHALFSFLGRWSDRISLRMLEVADAKSPQFLPLFRNHQLRTILSLTPIMMVANLVNGAAFAILEIGLGRMSAADWVWLSTVATIAVRTLAKRRSDRGRGASTTSSRTIGKLVVSSILLGAIWAYPLTILAGETIESDEVAFVSALVAGMVAGGSMALYPAPLAALAYVTLISLLVPPALMVGIPHLAVPLTMVTAMYFVIVIVTVFRHHSIFLCEFQRRLSAETQKDMLDLLVGNDQDRSDNCIWQTDAALDLLTSSLPVRRILGLGDQRLPDNLAALIIASGVSSRDDHGRSALPDLVSGMVTATEGFEFEVQLTTAEGHGRTLLLAGRRVARPSDGTICYNGYVKDISEEARAQAEVLRLATHDDMTGLPNHVEFLRRARVIIDEHADCEQAFYPAVMFVDADNLKRINDGFGHQAGDALLKNIAARLRRGDRPGRVVCRKGGDEFLVFEVFTSEGAFRLAAQALLVEMNGEFEFAGRKLNRRCTVGASFCVALQQDVLSLEAEADTALKAQKKHGKSELGFFSSELADVQMRQLSIARDISDAIATEALVVHFQPIVAADGRTIVAAEALLRWHHPELGPLDPQQVIDVATAEGYGSPLTEFVLRSALSHCRSWPARICLSVNICATQLARPDFAAQVCHLITQSGVTPDRLWIEITEKELLPDSDSVRRNIERLRAAGVKLVIDDFGVGYSGLRSLDVIDWDVIKVDRSIVQDCHRRPTSLIMIHALHEIASRANRQLVIEGIENRRDFKALAGDLAVLFQGFLFHRAMPPDQLASLFGPSIALPEMLPKTGVPIDRDLRDIRIRGVRRGVA